jgi:hypothetical protein
MKGFYIEVSNGLLDPKHVRAMKGDEGWGTVWLFMWFLDKITSIDEGGIGKVLGGRPIKYETIGLELGISRSTYHRWLGLLREGGYINTIRTPKGLQVSINKAKKRFNQSVSDVSPKTHQLESDFDGETHHKVVSRHDRDTSNIRQDNRQDREGANVISHPHKHISYLLGVPDSDIPMLSKNLDILPAQIRSKGDTLWHYCQSKGKKYANYRSFLRNALTRDFPWVPDGPVFRIIPR